MNRPLNIRNIATRVALYHFPFLAYAALILYLSSQPSLKQPIELPYGADKVIHLIEYALFAFFVFRSFTDLFTRQRIRLTLILSTVFILSFSILDELYQGTIPGRQQDPFDIVADFIGGVIILVLLGHRRSKEHLKTDLTRGLL